jgi:hypothetical protein
METQANNYAASPTTLTRVSPTSGQRISSPFNRLRTRDDGSTYRHGGIDIAVPVGTPVAAADSGVVERVTNQPNGAGKFIEIRHEDGTSSLYMHLSRQDVTQGSRVTAGQQIGLSGNTGNSDGPHLHFEVRDRNGNKIDPNQFLAGASSPVSQTNDENQTSPTETTQTNPLRNFVTALSSFIRGNRGESNTATTITPTAQTQVPSVMGNVTVPRPEKIEIIQGVPGKENRATPAVRGAPDRVRTSSSSQRRENKPSTASQNVISPVMSIYAYSMYWGVGD